jgi:hypothetical protein
MKHLFTVLFTALVLAAPAQAQKPQPKKERPQAGYIIIKELKKEVEILKKEVAELKKIVKGRRGKRGQSQDRGRSRRPSVREQSGRKGKTPTPPMNREEMRKRMGEAFKKFQERRKKG